MVHEQYPEINIEVIPYSGQNYTAYVTAQLETGDMPDLYCTTYYTPGSQKVDDKLIDMSGYAFTDCYAEARLREVTDNGAIYMLPAYFDCMGITYNKTLLTSGRIVRRTIKIRHITGRMGAADIAEGTGSACTGGRSGRLSAGTRSDSASGMWISVFLQHYEHQLPEYAGWTQVAESFPEWGYNDGGE